MKKSEVYGKRIECIIGIFLLIPPFLGVIAFAISIFSQSYAGDFASMNSLSSEWTAYIKVPVKEIFPNKHSIEGSAAAMSAAPFYLGLMAITGAYLIKNSMEAFFTKGG